MSIHAQSHFGGTDTSNMCEEGYLSGQFLIASPAMRDERFHECVIYMCVHDEEQAMGIIINKPKDGSLLSDILPDLEVEGEVTHHNNEVLYGGPVEQNRGFVLHSRDFFNAETSLPLSSTLALSTSKSILEALVNENAPERAVLALGYTGWHAGQLESEIMSNSWLIAPADEALIFAKDHKDKWKQALASLGIAPAFLSSQAGHA